MKKKQKTKDKKEVNFTKFLYSIKRNNVPLRVPDLEMVDDANYFGLKIKIINN